MAGLVEFEGGTYRDLNDVLINGEARGKKPFNIIFSYIIHTYCYSHFLLFILRYSVPSLYKTKILVYFEFKAREKYTTPVYTKTLVCQTCARAKIQHDDTVV